MNDAYMLKVASLAGATLLVLGAVTTDASAQSSGYLTDQRGAVVKDAFGLCWRTGFWSPSLATSECDPDLMPKKAAPTPPAPRAAPAAPASRAASPAKPRPVVPMADKITLSADTLFDFNKAVVRPDANTRLDELVKRLKGVSVDTIIVVGHADRLGSDAYNMKLSLRRADAVKSYLVSKGTPANRIYAEGKGKKQPVTKPGSCKGPKSPAVIRCLQPDRRVVIEVVGTRLK